MSGTRFRLFVRIGCAIAAALALPADRAAADFTPPKTIVIALDDNYAPYSFRPEHGAVQGIMRDLWDLWSKRTGVGVEFVAVERAQRLKVLDARKVDVAGYLVGTDTRAAHYLIAPVPPVHVDMVIFFDRAISGITGVESLAGFTVGSVGNGSCTDFLTAHGVTSLKIYPDWDSLFGARPASGGSTSSTCKARSS